MDHVPGAVSPMIAAGRVVKRLHPEALTVFIGPCLAKKAEAREADVADAVDYVLTFQEVNDLFEAAKIDPKTLPERGRDHSSRAGRVYASYQNGTSVEKRWEKHSGESGAGRRCFRLQKTSRTIPKGRFRCELS